MNNRPPAEESLRSYLAAEEDYAEPILLVQSGIAPDWSKLPSNYTPFKPECKAIELSFRAGQLLRFRLRTNPTKKLQVHTAAGDRKKNGKRVALLTEEEQISWLVRQGERHEITDQKRQRDPVFAGGFRLHEVKPSLERKVTVYSCDVAAQGWVHNRKKEKGTNIVHDLTHFAVCFEGVIEVTEPDLLCRTVAAGIGPAKAFGFGLLSLAKAES